MLYKLQFILKLKTHFSINFNLEDISYVKIILVSVLRSQSFIDPSIFSLVHQVPINFGFHSIASPKLDAIVQAICLTLPELYEVWTDKIAAPVGQRHLSICSQLLLDTRLYFIQIVARWNPLTLRTCGSSDLAWSWALMKVL